MARRMASRIAILRTHECVGRRRDGRRGAKGRFIAETSVAQPGSEGSWVLARQATGQQDMPYGGLYGSNRPATRSRRGTPPVSVDRFDSQATKGPPGARRRIPKSVPRLPRTEVGEGCEVAAGLSASCVG